MAFYHDPGEADHACPVIAVGVETCGHSAQHRSGNETGQGRGQRRLELLSHAVTDEARSALHRLQSHVACEPIRYYNVHLAGEDVVSLHEPNVVETRGLQQRVCCLHAFVAFDVLFPDVEQTNPGVLESMNVAGDDGAHCRKLTQLLRSGFRVCTQIEHLCVAVCGWNR